MLSLQRFQRKAFKVVLKAAVTLPLGKRSVSVKTKTKDGNRKEKEWVRRMIAGAYQYLQQKSPGFNWQENRFLVHEIGLLVFFFSNTNQQTCLTAIRICWFKPCALQSYIKLSRLFPDNSVLLSVYSRKEMFANSFLKAQLTLLFQPTMAACTGFYLISSPAIKTKK